MSTTSEFEDPPLQAAIGFGDSEEVDDISIQVLRLLRSEDVIAVRSALIYLEGTTSNLYIEAVANFRDAFNHLSMASSAEESRENRLVHIEKAKDHLAHSVHYPFQDAIDDKIHSIEKKSALLIFYFRRWMVQDDIVSPREREQKLNDAKTLLIQGRHLKSVGEMRKACDIYIKCFSQLEELSQSLLPSKLNMLMRCFFGITSALLVVLFGILTIYVGTWALSLL